MARYGTRKYRRYRRRSNRRLSTRRIFSRTSAKSQATQIAALRNRINSVYRRVKPEVKNLVAPAINVSFSSGALSTIWFTGIFPKPDVGNTSDVGAIGNYVRNLGCQLNSIFEYYNNSTTGYHDSESAGCQLRFIILQRKVAELYTTSYDLDEFLPNPSNTGSEYSTLCVKPLRTGITERWNVLLDRKYTMTTEKNQLSLSLRFKPKSYRFNNSNSNIFNYVKYVIVVSGLHFDENFKEYVEGSLVSKLAYTDP